MYKGTGNAGHLPGVDPGAVGLNGLQEAFVTKDITEQINMHLTNAGVQMQFVQLDSLSEVCEASNKFDSDFFFSIHCNAAENRQANGMEIYTSRGNTGADELATCIMNQMSAEFPDLYVRSDYSDGDVDKEAGFYVLNNTDAPAVLIELAFISNPKEEAMLADASIRARFAASIARGITDWLQIINKRGN